MRPRSFVTISAAALWLSVLAISATAGEFLTGKRLDEELGGQTIKGYYLADKVNFVEVYVAGGRIAYKDDLKADAGRWSVRDKLFCTFYDKITGGCWYVVKHSVNCFEFHRESDFPEATVTRDELVAVRAHARAARDSDKVTCESWFGS